MPELRMSTQAWRITKPCWPIEIGTRATMRGLRPNRDRYATHDHPPSAEFRRLGKLSCEGGPCVVVPRPYWEFPKEAKGGR